MTTTTPAHVPSAATTTRAHPAQLGSRIGWRTVAFATAVIYAAAVPAAVLLHATTPRTDLAPQVTRTCVHGQAVNVTTEPGGWVTLTAPSDLPACTGTETR